MAHLTRQQQEGFRIRHRSGCVSNAMESPLPGDVAAYDAQLIWWSRRLASASQRPRRSCAGSPAYRNAASPASVVMPMDKLVKRGIATIVIGLGLIWAVAAGFALLFSVLS